MTMRIYYAPRSSATRALWALEEVGEPYDKVRVSTTNGETRRPEFLKLNPNGKVPTLVDGDIVIWESMAIIDYLSGKYPKAGLLPEAPAVRAEILKWLYYGLVSVQAVAYEVMSHRLWLPEEKRIPAFAELEMTYLLPRLKILDDALASREWIAGPFSLADFAYGGLVLLPYAGVTLDETPNVKAYAERLKARPAYQRANAIE
jgi:glutathione S-transferase